MNSRLALVIVLGLTVVLVFIGWLIHSRRARQRSLLASQRERIGNLQNALDEVRAIANDATDVDPSAALIITMLDDRKRKELL